MSLLQTIQQGFSLKSFIQSCFKKFFFSVSYGGGVYIYNDPPSTFNIAVKSTKIEFNSAVRAGGGIFGKVFQFFSNYFVVCK